VAVLQTSNVVIAYFFPDGTVSIVVSVVATAAFDIAIFLFP